MKDEDYNIPEDQDYTSAVSAYDCTGLIPAGTVHEKELEAYKELYPFGAPDMSSHLLRLNQRLQRSCHSGTAPWRKLDTESAPNR